MQFLLIAYDATDDKAMDRRMAAREAHLANIAQYKAKGHMHMGAALLDEEGKMIGSTIIAEFSSRAEMEQWLASDPYITGKVWTKTEIIPCKIAPSFLSK